MKLPVVRVQWLLAFGLWFAGSLLVHGNVRQALVSTVAFGFLIGGLWLALRTPPQDRHIKP